MCQCHADDDGDVVIAIIIAICHYCHQYHHHWPWPSGFNWKEKKERLDYGIHQKTCSRQVLGCFQRHKASEGWEWELWRHFERCLEEIVRYANWNLIDVTTPKSILYCASVPYNATTKPNYVLGKGCKTWITVYVPFTDRKYMDSS